MRILYVEDATFLAEAVKHNLEKEGFLVDLANDGEDGLDKALKDIYDCVVLDIMLPKLSGTDILKRMREKNVQTPVIMLSALSEVETKVGHLDKGADDYLLSHLRRQNWWLELKLWCGARKILTLPGLLMAI